MQHELSDQQLRELENRLLTYLLAKKQQNVKSTVGTQTVMIFIIMKPQRQQSDCMNGCLHSLDWTTGLDYWTGLLDS